MMILVILGSMILGAVLGSFACCQAWRIYYKEQGKKKLPSRSVCLSCGKQLKWYENIPIVSWVVQRGKCRKCGAKIGKAEILSEIVGVLMFVGLGVKFYLDYLTATAKMEQLSRGGIAEAIGAVMEGLYLKIELPIMIVIAVVFFCLMLIIGIYDARWQRIPVKVAVGAIVVGGLVTVLKVACAEAEWGRVAVESLLSVGVLGGLYFLLYKASGERLVGGGDYLVGTAIGLFLADWWLSLLVLFISNLSAVAVMVPMRKKKAAFGPFLVFGVLVVFIFSNYLVKFKLQI